jgi:N-acetylmuramoyl-L-alanine amidase
VLVGLFGVLGMCGAGACALAWPGAARAARLVAGGPDVLGVPLAGNGTAAMVLPVSPVSGTSGEAADPLDLALRGQDLLAAGDAAGAVAALERAVALDARSDFAWGLLGRAALATGDRTRAVAALRVALNLNPDDAYARMLLEYARQLPPVPGAAGAARPSPSALPDDLERTAQEEERRRAAELAEAARGGAHGFRLRRVVLDPGHGGVDPGAVGPSGLREKDVVLDTALRAARVLAAIAPELKVFLTRTDDRYVSLAARTALANRFGADLFVSLHANAAERAGAAGLETYWCSETASSKAAARVAAFENAVRRYDAQASGKTGGGKTGGGETAAGASGSLSLDVEGILFRFERERYWRAGGAAARAMRAGLVRALGLEDRGAHAADFYVLRAARMPAVLVEAGFISNPAEERMLASDAGRARVAAGLAASVAGLAREGV